jgi:hypothetical protein
VYTGLLENRRISEVDKGTGDQGQDSGSPRSRDPETLHQTMAHGICILDRVFTPDKPLRPSLLPLPLQARSI